jgi:DNA-binding CsgD family transcriptional regulator
VERQITENSMRHSRNTPNGGLRHLADAPLTNRERQIARLVSEKLANKEIAEKLNISVGTVKAHVHQVLKKFGFQKRSYLTNHSHNDQDFI